MICKIYTGTDEGASVETLTLKGADVKIQAIIVGEEGRGRFLGVIPVQGLPKDEKKIVFGELGQTRSGKPKLIYSNGPATTDAAIIVLRTKIGYRGGNFLHGDYTYTYKCSSCEGEWKKGDLIDEGLYKNQCPACLQNGWHKELSSNLKPLPLKILVTGQIAQGAAGAMGSGEQHVIVAHPGDIWVTDYYGRLYGGPSRHFWYYSGDRVYALTKEEREMSDLF